MLAPRLHALLTLLVAPVLLWGPTWASAVTLEWVTVGDPGNPADGPFPGFYGSVPYSYSISKYEITNAQYTEFLNAVAATDDAPFYLTLYDTEMGSGYGGITRSGSPGSYTYDVILGRGDLPVNFVTYHDALRFANWMANGQPSGPQGPGTTEDGSYTIDPSGPSARNPGATIVLASEDEWHKAAYYDPGSGLYFDYPAGSATPIVCGLPGPTPNTANCDDAVGDLTVGGSYSGSPSPWGTFDQGGNVIELTETWLEEGPDDPSPFVALRGGMFSNPYNLIAGTRPVTPAYWSDSGTGFRLVRLPAPGVSTHLVLGGLALCACARRAGGRALGSRASRTPPTQGPH